MKDSFMNLLFELGYFNAYSLTVNVILAIGLFKCIWKIVVVQGHSRARPIHLLVVLAAICWWKVSFDAKRMASLGWISNEYKLGYVTRIEKNRIDENNEAMKLQSSLGVLLNDSAYLSCPKINKDCIQKALVSSKRVSLPDTQGSEDEK